MKQKVFVFNTNFPDVSQWADFRLFYRSIDRNIGNGYISYAIAKIFGLDPLSMDRLNSIWHDPWDESLIDRINAEMTHVFLILQDHIREDLKGLPYRRVADLLRKLKVPIVVWSLGANSFNGYDARLAENLSDDQIYFFKTLSDHSVSLGVRGPYTAEILERLNIRNFRIIGCPSYFEEGKNRTVLKRTPGDDYKVVAMGYFANKDWERLHYVLQSEELFMKVLHFPDSELDPREFEQIALMPDFYLHCYVKCFALKHMHFFTRIEAWKSFFREPVLFAVGSRLHGAIVAMNTGCPAAVTDGDARGRETCEYLGIPYLIDYSLEERAFVTDLLEIYNHIDIDRINTMYRSTYVEFENWLSEIDLFDDAFPQGSVFSGDIALTDLKPVSDSVYRERAFDLLERYGLSRAPNP